LHTFTKSEPSETDNPDIIPIRHANGQAPADPAIGIVADGAEPVLLPINRLASPPAGDSYEDYELPPLSPLEDAAPFAFAEHDQLLREKAALLEKTFKDFELNVRVVGINTGPVITQYEISLDTGLRVNKVTNLGDDLALNLKVPSVRIVAPIPGKNTVGIEIPNEHRAVLRLKQA